MKAVTCCLMLVGTAASVLCAAQPPATSPVAAQASSAPVQVTSGALQISSSPVQITLAPPRAVPAASEGASTATQNVLPGPLPKAHGTTGAYDGYTRVVIDGQERYCRDDVATGSHTERHTVCLTRAQVAAEQVRAQDFIEKVQRLGALGNVPTYMGGMSPAH
jgi:hypothetical protein